MDNIGIKIEEARRRLRIAEKNFEEMEARRDLACAIYADAQNKLVDLLNQKANLHGECE